MKDLLRTPARLASSTLLRLRPDAPHRPPGDRTVLDDIAMRRPWNLRVKAARWRAMRRLDSLRQGVTVIIVNWNTGPVTADVVRAVQHFSPPGTEILLIDNGSTDDSRKIFDGWPGIRTVWLRSNAGHGVALDLGLCWCETTIAVTLDSDAIPLGAGWLDLAVEPVQSGTAVLAGQRSRRGFVHPIYLAIDTAAFLGDHHASFQVYVEPGTMDDDVVWGENAFDTAELLSQRFHDDEKLLIEQGPNPADGLPGMTVADVVYHHGGVSRDVDGSIGESAFDGWRRACEAVGVGEVVRAAEGAIR